MNKTLIMLSCILFLTTTVISANNTLPVLAGKGRTVESFVPEGWKLIAQTSGDLNKDGLSDIAGVVESSRKWEGDSGDAAPRLLFIAFQGTDGLYRLSVQTEKAILREDQGGVWGDPFESLSVDRGSILIKFYGGSNYRWGYIYRFRYQDGGWYLIGATIDSYFTGTGEGFTEDFNLLTGKMIRTKTDDKGRKKEETINRGKKKLIHLKDFDINAEEAPF